MEKIRHMSTRWGKDDLLCEHPKILQRGGIVYCTKCGKNFHKGDLEDQDYYNLFENSEEF